MRVDIESSSSSGLPTVVGGPDAEIRLHGDENETGIPKDKIRRWCFTLLAGGIAEKIRFGSWPHHSALQSDNEEFLRLACYLVVSSVEERDRLFKKHNDFYNALDEDARRTAGINREKLWDEWRRKYPALETLYDLRRSMEAAVEDDLRKPQHWAAVEAMAKELREKKCVEYERAFAIFKAAVEGNKG